MYACSSDSSGSIQNQGIYAIRANLHLENNAQERLVLLLSLQVKHTNCFVLISAFQICCVDLATPEMQEQSKRMQTHLRGGKGGGGACDLGMASYGCVRI